MPKTGKSHSVSSIVFDTLGLESFETVASVGAGVTNATVQSRLPLAVRCKIRKMVATCSAIGTGGTHSVNIVVGTGAAGAIGGQDAQAAAGASLFTTAQALSVADTPVVSTPTEPDVIYAAGALLTLRAVTPASTGLFTNLKVSIALIPVDGAPGDNNVNTF